MYIPTSSFFYNGCDSIRPVPCHLQQHTKRFSSKITQNKTLFLIFLAGLVLPAYVLTYPLSFNTQVTMAEEHNSGHQDNVT